MYGSYVRRPGPGKRNSRDLLLANLTNILPNAIDQLASASLEHRDHAVDHEPHVVPEHRQQHLARPAVAARGRRTAVRGTSARRLPALAVA